MVWFEFACVVDGARQELPHWGKVPFHRPDTEIIGQRLEVKPVTAILVRTRKPNGLNTQRQTPPAEMNPESVATSSR